MIWVKDFKLIDGDLEGGADVWLTDGRFECCCFAWPFDGKVGNSYDQLISWLEVSNLVRSDVDIPILKQLDGWNHFVVGQLIDQKNGTVQVGEFLFDLEGTIPNDTQEGKYVEFKAHRPDMY
ncbi:hypothetical protein [Streptococcus ruminantium]|uniref:hypothetical protein n=1 Tax=Streptococcus ruminantium TaxID=1917441 RepID=UPI0012DC51D5|nr:hypothetical protein [Streptococcus ruminantium]